jgi:hypothetical protein
VLRERGFGEEDGVVYVNALRAKTSAKKIAAAVKKAQGISDKLIQYVAQERRVDDWAEQNIDAILNCEKAG